MISISKKVCGLLTILTVIAGSGCGENASETTVTSPESVSMEASSSQGESTDMAASEETIAPSETTLAVPDNSIDPTLSKGQKAVDISEIEMYDENVDHTVWDNDESVIEKCLNLPQENMMMRLYLTSLTLVMQMTTSLI